MFPPNRDKIVAGVKEGLVIKSWSVEVGDEPFRRPWVGARSPRTSKLLCEQQGGTRRAHRAGGGVAWRGSAPSQVIRGSRSWMDPSGKHRPV